MTSGEVAIPRRSLRQMRSLVAGIVAGFLILGMAGIRVESVASRADSTAEDVELEAERRQVEICEWARRDRAETEQLLLGLAEDLDAGQDVMDLIRDRYDRLPPLQDC